jgi:serine/threonine protein kinase/tetratricopeptide (TPR) repeat protein
MPVDDPNDDSTKSFAVLTVGTCVAHYRIVRKIGAGGMGEVYLAEDTKLKRRVALKFLPSRVAADENLKGRFTREAQAAAALRHPNIVTIHEVAEHKGCPYIAMEYIAGESLRDLIRRGRVSYEMSLDILSQLCSGLAEAHAAGIVHRDIKPSNIMIDKKGCCIILDFGLAKGDTDTLSTSPGAIVGTAGYMSPEQGQGLKVDHRSDIFSLGVVFYEMLTGNSPFKRDNIPATIYSLVHEQPEKIEKYFDCDTECWQQITDKMLAKTPADRYQNIDLIIADVDRLKKAEPLLPLSTGQVSAAPPDVSSLAVLYLRNLGPPEDEYLSHGITEDLIVDLTRIGSIRVAPMRSVRKYKDSDKELVDIARALDVSLILDGSIHKTESKVRASAQLIDVASGKHLWADRWEDTLDRLHLIKTALAEGVSTALAIDSSVVRAAQVGEPEARNPKAYEYYLRGKYTFEHRHSSSDVRIASDLYDQALKLEPNLLAAREGVAEILILEGQYEQANQVLLSALIEARQRGQQADEARTLRLLAQCFSSQSLWAEADSYAQAAVQISQELGDLAGQAVALGELIETRQRRAMFDEALQLADRVLKINRQLNDRDKEAEALNLIGNVHIHKGDCHSAMAMYQEALAIAEDRDQTSVKASSIGNIGTAYYYLGDFEKALSQYEESLQMFSDLGESMKKAAVAHNMAGIHLSRGAYHKALELYDSTYAVYLKYRERARCAATTNNIAHVLTILGQYDKAISKLEEVLEETANMGYPLVMALARANLGFAYYCQGKDSQAAQELQAAVEVAEQAGLRRVLAMALSYLGEMHYMTGRRELSYEYFQKSVTVAEAVGDKQTCLMNRAYLATKSISPEDSQACFHRQREIVNDAEKFGDPRLILVAERLLAECLIHYGGSPSDHQEGLRILSEALSYAQDKEIAFEVERIRSALQRASSAD